MKAERRVWMSMKDADGVSRPIDIPALHNFVSRSLRMRGLVERVGLWGEASMIFPYFLPAPLEALAHVNGDGIEAKENDEKNNDGRRRARLKGNFGQVRPQEDLNRQHGCGFSKTLGNIHDEGHHADHQQWRGLAKGAGHAENCASENAGHRQGSTWWNTACWCEARPPGPLP